MGIAPSETDSPMGQEEVVQVEQAPSAMCQAPSVRCQAAVVVQMASVEGVYSPGLEVAGSMGKRASWGSFKNGVRCVCRTWNLALPLSSHIDRRAHIHVPHGLVVTGG